MPSIHVPWHFILFSLCHVLLVPLLLLSLRRRAVAALDVVVTFNDNFLATVGVNRCCFHPRVLLSLDKLSCLGDKPLGSILCLGEFTRRECKPQSTPGGWVYQVVSRRYLHSTNGSSAIASDERDRIEHTVANSSVARFLAKLCLASGVVLRAVWWLGWFICSTGLI